MMVLTVIVLSIVQAITEFVPISSSAHLLLVPWLTHLPDPGLAFDAAIHIGTATALVVFFWKDFVRIIKKRDKLLWYILVASIPAALLGFFGDRLIERTLHEASYAPLVVGLGLMFFGVVLYLVDHYSKKEKVIEQMNWFDSLFVGFAQAVALIPGTSRSGITITAGLLMGYTREEAARFSFLLATPISLGAGAYKLYDIIKHPAEAHTSLWLTLLGIVVTFAAGIVVIKWLLDYLKKHSMLIFVIYRLVVGGLVVLIWWLRR